MEISKTCKRKDSGFTLIEVVVALFIFSLIGGTALNLLVSGIAAQRSSVAGQTLIDQTSFVAEYMSRALRQAGKDLTSSGQCIPRGWNYQIITATTIRFLDRDNKCRDFFFSTASSQVYQIISANHQVSSPRSEQPLTSNNVDVQALTFSAQGENNQTDNLQPRVTFSLQVRAHGEKPSVFFQTTISQRRFDVVE